MVGFIFLWLSRILVTLFFVGLVGSAVVVIITFVEDGKLLLEGDEPAAGTTDSQRQAAGVSHVSSRETF